MRDPSLRLRPPLRMTKHESLSEFDIKGCEEHIKGSKGDAIRSPAVALRTPGTVDRLLRFEQAQRAARHSFIQHDPGADAGIRADLYARLSDHIHAGAAEVAEEGCICAPLGQLPAPTNPVLGGAVVEPQRAAHRRRA